MKIGFFDSGTGGRLVAEYFHREHSIYDIVVLGDRENMPYGNKSEEVLQDLIESHIRTLFVDQDCVIVVVACNTLSVKLVRHIQDTFVAQEFPDRRVLGVVIPTVEAIEDSEHSSFLLLGTEGTVASERYVIECNSICPNKNIMQVPAPGLALLIEEGKLGEAEGLAQQILDEAVSRTSIDVIVLACTHYIMLKDYLRIRFPEKEIFSQDEIVSKKLGEYLIDHPELESRISKGGHIEIL